MPRIPLMNVRALNGQAGFGQLVEPSPLSRRTGTPSASMPTLPPVDDGNQVYSILPYFDVTPEEQKRMKEEDEKRKKLEDSCSIWQILDSCPKPVNAAGGATASVCGEPKCATTPLSVLRAPGLVISKAIRPLFPDDYKDQAELLGHVLAGLLIIGGVAYGFTRVSKR